MKKILILLVVFAVAYCEPQASTGGNDTGTYGAEADVSVHVDTTPAPDTNVKPDEGTEPEPDITTPPDQTTTYPDYNDEWCGYLECYLFRSNQQGDYECSPSGEPPALYDKIADFEVEELCSYEE